MKKWGISTERWKPKGKSIGNAINKQHCNEDEECL